jgi:hypothetical protein
MQHFIESTPQSKCNKTEKELKLQETSKIQGHNTIPEWESHLAFKFLGSK